ncbi:MAG: ABC transporter permease [Clostridium sp.]|nr:ABC transporter permease [Clostridium sp.]
MSIFSIFKNNFYRIISKKAIVITAIIFIPLMIAGGVYFTANMETKVNIAVVSKNQKLNMSNKYFNLKVIDEKPKMSDLVLNKYDAVIVDKGNMKFKVITIKSNKLKNQIENFIKNPKSNINFSDSENKRGVGTNILGFMMMIILMQQISIMLLYPEDRDLGTFKRILIAPVSSGKYLLAQGIFDFIVTFVPSYISIVAAKVIFKVDIGFGYGTFAGFLALLMLIGTGFSLCITSIMDDVDNASMLGTFIVMIGSIVSGSFYSFTDNSKILDNIIKLIPFKGYLTLVQGVENGKSLFNYSGQLIYIFAVSLILFIIGTLITRKNLKSGKY